jgi:molybdopterin synthase catalytic subunit
MIPPAVELYHDGNTWLGITAEVLPVAEAYEWAVRADCGAVVLFSGTVRDHADGRPGVQHLTYEAYEEQAVPKLVEIAAEVRVRWPSTGAVVLLHRTGQLAIGESSVIVVVSSPHRPEAFEAGRYAIDALKASVPIWKHEVWDGGSDWGTGAQVPTDASTVPTATAREHAS